MQNLTYFIRPTFLAATLLSACPVFAADDDSGNYLSVDVGYRASQSLLSGDRSGIGLYIHGRYQWRGLFTELPSAPRSDVSGPTLGYNFFNTEHWLFDAVYVWINGDHRLSGTIDGERVDLYREQSESFGLRATGVYGSNTLQFAVLPLNNEEYDRGTYASAYIAREWQVSNWTVRGVAGAQYRSDEIMDFYFGVDSGEATPSLPEYTAKAGTRLSMQLEALYPLTTNVVLSGYVAHREFLDNAKDSPILRVVKEFDDRPGNETAVGIVLSYVF